MSEEKNCWTCKHDHNDNKPNPYCEVCCAVSTVFDRFAKWEPKKKENNMNREEVIRRLEEIADLNGCVLYLRNVGWDPSLLSFIFRAKFQDSFYAYIINLDEIDENWYDATYTNLRNKIINNNVTYVSHRVPKIKKVIFNDPATIIIWKDNTKTVVKAEGETFDPEKGMAMAIVKKALGNQSKYYNEFKKWLPVPEESDNDISTLFRDVGISVRKSLQDALQKSLMKDNNESGTEK